MQLWARWRGRFPNVQEHPEVPPVQDELSSSSVPPAFTLQVVDATSSAPLPRFWFMNETGSELVQVQRDRIVHNWRRLTPESPYPHYEALRPSFSEDLTDFQAFLDEFGIGKFNPYQCELTYINPIPLGRGIDRLGEFERLLAPWSGSFTDDFLSEPESVAVALRFPITDSSGRMMGRLHISAQPVQSQEDGTYAILLQLVARGRPYDQSIEGILKFLDLGHEWIVKGFASITAEEMHRIWGRTR
jgi:uncharacterized protein (TIGR04255 family)